ncbi:unnamed protein product [Kuraishia capsulata CBS 1993]|uniref:Serine/threonine-protein kinase RIO1 n=1 Tax=Kuraishia capsulata CBS 1993 TaxID=1382522 RepID=W6ML48_9ASCO|nr:uncharacterized protein KUCA_T00001462001 [Kuraishia capsulata CBS 1993]CDK25492.1 unnamed protein product [Kuraishia capsulata CBS 1993]
MSSSLRDILEDMDLSSDSDSDMEQRPTTQAKAKKVTHAASRDNAEILAKYSDKIKTDEFLFKSHRITRDKAERATVESVLDPRTIGFILKLFKNGTITQINGCISTGKEANVYHAMNEETGKEYAVKIYKTSILVFKDRERYVDGEFRFRNTKSQHNPRKMVKVWAEKEFRNLKRLHSNGILSPEPVDLKSHVLVMDFLGRGDGGPSPKLKDYVFKDVDQIVKFYQDMLIAMRRMYQQCKLVHADLSEYNSIVHNEQLYIFDVSQSVEHDHPMSLDFLRMDIKNVNDFFERVKHINVFPERLIFKFIIQEWSALKRDVEVAEEDPEFLAHYLHELPLKGEIEGEEQQDDIFRSLHLISSLNHLDERDFEKFSKGNMDSLKDLVGDGKNGEGINGDGDEDSHDDDDEDDDDDDEDEEDENDSGSSGSETEEKEWTDREKDLRGKKHEDKNAKKLRKKEAKDQAKEKRKTKMKKHVKKKLVNKAHKGSK